MPHRRRRSRSRTARAASSRLGAEQNDHHEAEYDDGHGPCAPSRERFGAEEHDDFGDAFHPQPVQSGPTGSLRPQSMRTRGASRQSVLQRLHPLPHSHYTGHFAATVSSRRVGGVVLVGIAMEHAPALPGQRVHSLKLPSNPRPANSMSDVVRHVVAAFVPAALRGTYSRKSLRHLVLSRRRSADALTEASSVERAAHNRRIRGCELDVPAESCGQLGGSRLVRRGARGRGLGRASPERPARLKVGYPRGAVIEEAIRSWESTVETPRSGAPRTGLSGASQTLSR